MPDAKAETPKYEYHLKHWGQITDRPWLEKDLGVTAKDHWFPSEEARSHFRQKLQACA